jgi:succinyl-diaminopimelate desuccinylase
MEINEIEKIVANIDTEGLTDLVQALVRIPTSNPPGNEKPAAELVALKMKEIGLDVLTQEVEPERWNTIGTLKGGGEKSALLIEGHLDTVPVGAGEKWIVDPFSAEIIDGNIYGRGSMDDKGGVAIMVMAMKAIIEAGVKLKRDVICAAVADEEGWMRGVKHLIGSGTTKNVTECICVDGYSSTMLRRWFPGRTYGYIHVLGRTAHSGTYPALGVGVNAIHKAAKLISEIDRTTLEHPEDPVFKHSHWQCLMIEGGWDPKGACVVPDRVTIALDARLVTNHDPDDVWAQIQRIIDRIKSEDENFNAEIEVAERRPSWEISMDEPLIKAMHAAYEQVLGSEPQYNVYPEFPSKGTMDLHWLAYEGIKCQPLASTRVGDYKESRAHRANEFVSIEHLNNAVKVLVSSILRLCA